MWGRDQSWWATLLLMITIPLFFDILVKVFKFMFKPNDDELFRVYEKDLELRRFFENSAFRELYQSWTFPHDQSTTKTQILKALRKIGLKVGSNSQNDSLEDKLQANQDHYSSDDLQSAISRKRAGTNPLTHELPPSGEGFNVYSVTSNHNYNISKMDMKFCPVGNELKSETSLVVGPFQKLLEKTKKMLTQLLIKD